MTAQTLNHIKKTLHDHPDPYLNKPFGVLGVIKNVTIVEDQVNITLSLGYPANGLKNQLAAQIIKSLRNVHSLTNINVNIDCLVAPSRSKIPKIGTLDKVKNIIAVTSCKGGVGKSTTSINLALALTREGAKVGLLDADIYGPNLPMMLGTDENTKPEVRDEKYFVPIKQHDIETMSIGYLLPDDTSLAWRGPMISKALTQMLTQTLWSTLDYLVIDLPPGTGDTQLSLAQNFPISGSVVVTTPQEIALLDAQKGIQMFKKVNIPLLGIIENMSLHLCSNCGHKEHIFGSGGGEKLAAECGAPFLGSLPLLRKIREHADNGYPITAADPDGTIGQLYRDLARNLTAQLWGHQMTSSPD